MSRHWLSETIRDLRRERKMTVKKLSNLCSVSVHTINSIESRNHIPNIRTAERILSALEHELEAVSNGKA